MNEVTVFSPSCNDLVDERFFPRPRWPMTMVSVNCFQYVCNEAISNFGCVNGVIRWRLKFTFPMISKFEAMIERVMSSCRLLRLGARRFFRDKTEDDA